MFSYDVKIPKERVAVLIGEKGETKREIESNTKSKLLIDSKEGDVNITGEDGVLLYAAQHIVKAIGRGFNPEIALRLLKPDWAFELIDLTNHADKQTHQQRLKGRVIGAGGKSRKVIEELAECSISVYGKTIGIIAPIETISIAKHAVDELLDGAQHAGVFKWLEKQRRDLKLQRMIGTNPA